MCVLTCKSFILVSSCVRHCWTLLLNWPSSANRLWNANDTNKCTYVSKHSSQRGNIRLYMARRVSPQCLWGRREGRVLPVCCQGSESLWCVTPPAEPSASVKSSEPHTHSPHTPAEPAAENAESSSWRTQRTWALENPNATIQHRNIIKYNSTWPWKDNTPMLSISSQQTAAQKTVQKKKKVVFAKYDKHVEYFGCWIVDIGWENQQSWNLKGDFKENLIENGFRCV